MNKRYIMTVTIVIFALCLMMIPIILVSGCAAEPSEEEIALPTPDFTSIRVSRLIFMIDNNTHIVYIYDNNIDGGGISPYYLLDENDVPHMVKWENNEFVLLPNN